MKRVSLVLSLLLALAGSASVWADGIPQISDPRNAAKLPWTVTVFNDSGLALSSGTVVVWDSGDTDFTSTRFPYITTTTSADDIWTAGVVYSATCADQAACEIVVYGPTAVLCADNADAVGINTTVGTATTAGQCGDYTPGANVRSLGTAMQAGSGSNNTLMNIFVNTLGAPAEQ